MAPPQQQPDIAGALARGEIDPIYCLSGEAYLVQATASAIRAAVLAEAGPAAAFNQDVYELKEKGLGTALATARTLPMMARRRLVVGKGIDEVKAADLEPLATYAEDPNPSTCLLLVAEKVDVRFKAFQTLRKRGYLHVFAAPRDREVPGWIRTEARARKIAIGADAAEALAAATGADLGRIAQALDQLALYAGGEPISAAHVEALVAETRQRGIFELTKAIGAGNVAGALALLANMLRNREPALRIQYMLARHLRQVWRAKELAASGAPRGDIASAVGINPYFLDDILVPAKRMTRAALADAFERLFQADVDLKSSKLDPEIGLARLVQTLAESSAGTASSASTSTWRSGGQRPA
ncbi:MAG TPA: DNA polymerase III subunit delta [Polyangia bacterium]|nr:DNA polymerase III subunit delta [Polyangia bacterium]